MSDEPSILLLVIPPKHCLVEALGLQRLTKNGKAGWVEILQGVSSYHHLPTILIALCQALIEADKASEGIQRRGFVSTGFCGQRRMEVLGLLKGDL